MLTDAHVHLDKYPPEERHGVLGRARETGVGWLVTVGIDLDSSERAVELAHAHKGVLAAVGIHPWAVTPALPAGFAGTIRRLGTEAGVVAVGEVGLDFVENLFLGVDYRVDMSSRQAQQTVFRRQVEVAVDLGHPLNIHCRGAYPKLLAILAEEKGSRSRGVVHNFDGDTYSLTRLLDLGFYVSFGGGLTYPDSEASRKAAKAVPLDALLLETDAPYMPLQDEPTEVNEPANVTRIVDKLARIRAIEDAEIIEATYCNFVTLFGSESVDHCR